MKKVLLGGILLVSSSAFAQLGILATSPPPAKPQSFSEQKQFLTGFIKDHLKCIEAAQDEEDLMKCRPQHPPQGNRPPPLQRDMKN